MPRDASLAKTGRGREGTRQVEMYAGKFSGLTNRGPTGTRMSQCPLCFELFSGEKTFVLHRIEAARVSGEPGAYILGLCRDPESKGLLLDAKGVWSTPRDWARKQDLSTPRRDARASEYESKGLIL